MFIVCLEKLELFFFGHIHLPGKYACQCFYFCLVFDKSFMLSLRIDNGP